MACCGKNESDPNNVNTDMFTRDYQGNNNIKLIVKIQAGIRGFLARRRVAKLRSSVGTKSMMHHSNFQGPVNYENPEVYVRLVYNPYIVDPY